MARRRRRTGIGGGLCSRNAGIFGLPRESHRGRLTIVASARALCSAESYTYVSYRRADSTRLLSQMKCSIDNARGRRREASGCLLIGDIMSASSVGMGIGSIVARSATFGCRNIVRPASPRAAGIVGRRWRVHRCLSEMAIDAPRSFNGVKATYRVCICGRGVTCATASWRRQPESASLVRTKTCHRAENNQTPKRLHRQAHCVIGVNESIVKIKLAMMPSAATRAAIAPGSRACCASSS